MSQAIAETVRGLGVGDVVEVFVQPSRWGNELSRELTVSEIDGDDYPLIRFKEDDNNFGIYLEHRDKVKGGAHYIIENLNPDAKFEGKVVYLDPK